MILPIPHYQQSKPGRCLPVCVRMVLAGFGAEYCEERLSRILGTNEAGTPAFAITKLEQLGYAVDYGEYSLPQLTYMLNGGNPVIAFIQTMLYEHWNVDTAHAIVIVGAENELRFWIHDPELSEGPIAVSWNGLLATWQEFDFRAATITQK